MDMPSLELNNLNWIPERDTSDLSRPVASSTAVVGGDAASGRVDFFTRWEPHSYCSFHTHFGETVSVVLSGELHVEELDGTRKVRKAGHYARTPTGKRHYESAGPDGALVFFSLQSADGGAFELVAKDGSSKGVVSVSDMLAGQLGLQVQP